MNSMLVLAAFVMAAVPRPWTPVAANDGVVSVWGREYAFRSNALPVSVKSQGRELLAGPVRIRVTDGAGAACSWTKAGSWLYGATEDSATVCAFQESRKVTADAVTTVEFDGMMKCSLTLVAGPDLQRQSVSNVWLEIPLSPVVARLYQFYPYDWGRNENCGGLTGATAWPFRASVWIGDEESGFAWFCESDENFETADPARVIEVVPGTDETVLRIRLADGRIDLPRTWVFGLEATPVKPFDRTWNARHVVHAPQMGAGSLVRRPEVWWTAQRAFPHGGIDETLDMAAAAGAKVIAFHEDWIPVQNNPESALADFKPIVEACHARGMKAIVYDGYELSPLDPEWGEHHAEWLSKTDHGVFADWTWYRAPAQRDYRSCLRSGFGAKWLERAKRAYDRFGIDGYYLDGTLSAWACANERHGCGWTDGKGRRHCTYPIFAIRKVMRELYEFVDGRGGIINAHQSGYTCPATLAFAHAYWDGEQFVGKDTDVKRTLSLEKFRAEFMGVNHGVPCEFLCYPIPGKWEYEDALALALPHNVLVRPAGFVSVPRLAPVWKTLDDFGVTEAEFVPYWRNPVKVTPASVRVSVWRKRTGEALAVVSNLSPDESVVARITTPSGGTLEVPLEPFRMKLTPLEFGGDRPLRMPVK